MPVKIDKY